MSILTRVKLNGSLQSCRKQEVENTVQNTYSIMFLTQEQKSYIANANDTQDGVTLSKDSKGGSQNHCCMKEIKQDPDNSHFASDIHKESRMRESGKNESHQSTLIFQHQQSSGQFGLSMKLKSSKRGETADRKKKQQANNCVQQYQIQSINYILIPNIQYSKKNFVCGKCSSFFNHPKRFILHCLYFCQQIQNPYSSHFIKPKLIEVQQNFKQEDITDQTLQIEIFISQKHLQNFDNLTQMSKNTTRSKLSKKKLFENTENRKSTQLELMQTTNKSISHKKTYKKENTAQKIDEFEHFQSENSISKLNVQQSYCISSHSASSINIVGANEETEKVKDQGSHAQFIKTSELNIQTLRKYQHLKFAYRNQCRLQLLGVFLLLKNRDQIEKQLFVCSCRAIINKAHMITRHLAKYHNFTVPENSSHVFVRLGSTEYHPVYLRLAMKVECDVRQIWSCPCRPSVAMSNSAYLKHIMKVHRGISPLYRIIYSSN